jgi:hypothetical protein
MKINDYLNIVNDINLIVEKLTKKGIESNIKTTKMRIDKLSRRIDAYNNQGSNPYSKIVIDFFDDITLSVRASDEKKEDDFKGRQYFDVVGFSDNYFILQKDDWDSTIALKLTYNKLTTRISQRGIIKLFYNRDGNVYNGNATRSSIKEEIMYEIISLK